MAKSKHPKRTREPNALVASVSLIFLSGVYLLWIAGSKLYVPIGGFDEGIQLTGAMMVNRGAVPHQDFWTMYPAFVYHLVAAAFKALGNSVFTFRFVGRVFLATVWFLALVLVRLWKKKHGVRGELAAHGALFLVVALSAQVIELPVWISTSFQCLALLSYLIFSESGSSSGRWKLATCVLLALGAISKTNFAIYSMAAIFLGELAKARGPTQPDAKEVIRSTARAAWPFLAFPLGVFAVYVIWMGGANVIQQVLLFPSRLEPHRLFPYPASLEQIRNQGLALLPMALGSLAVLGLPVLLPAVLFKPRRSDAIALLGLAVLAVLGATPWLGLQNKLVPLLLAGFLLHEGLCERPRLTPSQIALLGAYSFFLQYGLSRSDSYHLAPIGVFAALALLAPSRERPLRSAVLGLILVIALHFAPYGHDSDHGDLSVQTKLSYFFPFSRLPERAMLPPYPDDLAELYKGGSSNPSWPGWQVYSRGIAEVANHLRSSLAPTDPIYVGVEQHQAVSNNMVVLYWILDRRPAVRAYELEPGLTTEKETQLAMIQELEATRPKLIFIQSGMGNADSQFLARGYRGATDLDAFIRSHYSCPASKGIYLCERR